MNAEARRQQAFVAAVLGDVPEPGARLQEQGERRRRGLAAYRANQQSIAERALAAACPTTAALIGDEDFAALARALWRAEPPVRGDLGQWGQGLPAFIEAQRDLDPWPFLGDAARLDLAVQRCESAADAALEPATLALLAQAEPDALRLHLLPAVQVLDSRWPIGLIHAAHQEPSPAGLAAMRAAIEGGEAQAVVVSRRGWRAQVSVVEPAVCAWMQALTAGQALDAALSAASAAEDIGPFDFDAWLVRALQQDWLWRATAASVPEENLHDPDVA
jgi:Putative DNA-binding domain